MPVQEVTQRPERREAPGMTPDARPDRSILIPFVRLVVTEAEGRKP